MRAGLSITPAIMIGGAGSRLWPLSRSDRPKQFLNLGGEGSMFQDTLSRFDAPGFSAPWLLANTDTMPHILRQLDEGKFGVAGIVVEPGMRGTAAAIATITLTLAAEDEDRLILVAPSDHFIRNAAQFRQAVEQAAPIAAAGNIVTFGIVPTAPETGFGYIARGGEIAVDGTVAGYVIERGGFREKPDRDTAARYVAEGALWNAGIFLFRAGTMIGELRRHAPETLDAVSRACDAGRRHENAGRIFVEPEASSFLTAPLELSIDVGVMERTAHAAVVPCDGIGWSDVGSLPSLWDIADKDGDENAVRGDGLLFKSRRSFVHAQAGRKIVGAHLDGMIVVDTEDALIVVPADKAQSVKAIVGELKAQAAPELVHSRHAAFNWGEAHVHPQDGGSTTISLRINAAGRITRHRCTAEFETWVVTGGALSVDLGERLALFVPGHAFELSCGDVISAVAVNDEARITLVTSSKARVDLAAMFAVDPSAPSRSAIPLGSSERRAEVA